MGAAMENRLASDNSRLRNLCKENEKEIMELRMQLASERYACGSDRTSPPFSPSVKDHLQLMAVNDRLCVF